MKTYREIYQELLNDSVGNFDNRLREYGIDCYGSDSVTVSERAIVLHLLDRVNRLEETIKARG